MGHMAGSKPDRFPDGASPNVSPEPSSVLNSRRCTGTIGYDTSTHKAAIWQMIRALGNPTSVPRVGDTRVCLHPYMVKKIDQMIQFHTGEPKLCTYDKNLVYY